MCEQLNELLADTAFHDPSRRPDAERRFDSRVVDIFFDKMSSEQVDFAAIRERAIPIGSLEEDYRKILLLGTTGAGKTTLVRQLIGTDPRRERFPSTSTAKTTVHDTEIVLRDGPWQAAVTFVPSDEVREYLSECVSAAVLAAWRGVKDDEILRRLLSHVNQRYRFNYVLGNGPKQSGGEFDDEDDDEFEEEKEIPFEAQGIVDLDKTNTQLTSAVAELKSIAERLGRELRDTLSSGTEQDERVLDELFEEELDNLLRDEEPVHRITDALMDEMERRFDLLTVGKLTKSKQGWPISWQHEWPEDERSDFIEWVGRFSSNYAPYFGYLLSPLVNGVRVAGNFVPTWSDSTNFKYVLLDGEGLGHTPKSSSAISTNVTRKIESADVVLLVDNAAQPMQAAPVAAMKELVASGASEKLVFAFTHFDEVEGVNLPTANDKAQHVLSSAENVLAAVGEELGPFAERALRLRLEHARAFLGGLDEKLDPESKDGRRTIKQLHKLIDVISRVGEAEYVGESRPIYNKMNLVLAIKNATEHFQEAWFPVLGLTMKAGIPKEHWTRIKALSRRFATGIADEYDTLKPVADLRRELVNNIFVFIQNPIGWQGPEPDDDEKQAVFDGFADEISRRMTSLATRRVSTERVLEWQDAYDRHGKGSTFERARVIGDDIYRPAAPIPSTTPSPRQNELLRQVTSEVEAAAEVAGVSFQ
ncbi:MAG: hypothetical protein RIB46_12145 [Pseudomonadales bacterium]